MAVQLNAASPVEILVPERRRSRAGAPEHIIPGFARPSDDAAPEAWAAAFEDAYASAMGGLDQIPWREGSPDSALISWIDTEGPGIIRPGATMAIVGCGTGDDAAELASRGYDVTAFDVSPTAIAWAQRRFAHMADSFMCADLLAIPSSLRRRSDLVVEVETLTWLPPCRREQAVASLVSLARPRGIVLVIGAAGAGAASPDDHQGASPFPMEPDELGALMGAHGMAPLEPLGSCVIGEGGQRRLRAAFRRL